MANPDVDGTDFADLDAFIASLGIDMAATFVPLSRSDNPKQQQLNWTITLARGAATLATPYMQGIGHLAGYPLHKRQTVNVKENLAIALETGRCPRDWGDNSYNVLNRTAKLQPPKLRDVLHSLVMDSDALNHESFEDWASSTGYDSDSRKAEAIYNACLRHALTLRCMLGDANLAKLSQLFVDY